MKAMMMTQWIRRALPYALVIVGLAAIFHVGEYLVPIGCYYNDGVHFLKWPWQRCIVSSVTLTTDGSTYSQDAQDPQWGWGPMWYWPPRMSSSQAYTLMALGVVWIALRKRES
jgi:hypothetical protein